MLFLVLYDIFLSMKIMLFGATGMLGSMLEKILKKNNYEVIGYSSKTCDICDEGLLDCVFSKHSNVDVVINCAAYTRVDDAELETDLAFLLNADVIKNIAKKVAKINALFIHFSTDYVFDGALEGGAYVEEDKCSPISVYGKSKYLGEQYCAQLLTNYYIFRIQWLYGPNGNHFVSTMKRLFNQKKELRVIDDQIGTPTYTYSLSNYVAAVIKSRPKSGIYHCTDNGVTSWYEFCKEIASYENYKGNILPISSSEYKAPAKRPLNGRLDCTKLDRVLDIKRVHWKESLKMFYQNQIMEV
jgi:dTDP-4-dehydrorhamnose reductase